MYFLYISPAITDVQDLSVKKDEYMNVLSKVQEIKAKRDALSTEYNSISSSDMEKLNKIIPEEFNSVQSANNINNIALKNGMFIKTFRESSASTSNQATGANGSEVGKYKTNIISITLIGQYNQLVSFLKDIESSLELMDVVSLSLVGGGSKPTDTQYNYTLEINTYSLR